MNIGFLALRKGFLKVLGSVIHRAVDRGHGALLLWDPGETKPGEALTREDFAKAWPRAEVVKYRRGAPLLPLLAAIQTHRVSALVGPSLHYLIQDLGLSEEVESIRQSGIRLYSLDYVFETTNSDPDGYRLIDTTFYTSEYQRELHWRLMAEGFSRLPDNLDRHARSAVSGSTMMDQLAAVDRAAARERARERWGLAPDQPVVVLMSLKMAVPDPWRRLVWGESWRGLRAARAILKGHPGWVPEILGGHGYRALVEALRRFCQRTGAALIVKSRVKNNDPGFLRELDPIYDESVYPYTSMELMAIASFCLHFQSGAVLEAAFAGVPSLSVKVSQSHLREYASTDEVYGGKHGTLQNFPGIVWSASHREAVEMLDGAMPASFAVDAEARRRYVEKFLGFDDTRSSQRVVEAIERGG